MTELAPGDIVEITTPNGLAYAQVTHRHPAYPEVIRLLGGLHDTRPADLDALAAGPTRLTAMIPLGGAIARGSLRAERIDARAVPAPDTTFPTFKMPIRDKKGGIAYWWFWDGEGLRYDEQPGPEADAMPLREVLTADRLLERIAQMAGTSPAPA